MVRDGETAFHGLRYARGAEDLVRFREDPLDDIIARVGSDASRLDPGQRGTLRRLIREQDAYTLLLFARRRSVSGLRTGALSHAVEAIQCLTLVTADTIDHRDLSVDFPLYAARELGGDVPSLVADAVSVSEPGVASRFSAKANIVPTMTLQSCALMEVRSSYGLGFMSTWDDAYKPSADIAGCAVLLADGIDAEGTYVVSELHTSGLPSVWFGAARAFDQQVSGCVSFHAELRGEAEGKGHGLLVFLAELARPELCSELAARAARASTIDRPRVVAVHGRWMALIIGGSYVLGEKAIETNTSLARFQTISQRLLEQMAQS